MSAWRNDPTRFAFQWLHQGKKITRATSPTYKLKKAVAVKKAK